MPRVVLFGDGQLAALAQFYLTHDSPFEVVAFTRDGDHVTESTVRGLPVVPFEDLQRYYPPDDFSLFITIGYSGMNTVRERKYLEAKAMGYRLISYVSSKATTWPDLDIGDNCFIMEQTVVQPFTKIGDNVTIYSGCQIAHHSTIGSHVFLSAHVVVAGNVDIGDNCFLGVNATIRDGVTIGPHGVIGAGAVILGDTAPKGVYLGAKAKWLRIPSDRLPSL